MKKYEEGTFVIHKRTKRTFIISIVQPKQPIRQFWIELCYGKYGEVQTLWVTEEQLDNQFRVRTLTKIEEILYDR